MAGSAESSSEPFDRLFLAVAEELKLPLQYIARQAELHTMQLLAKGSGITSTASATNTAGMADMADTAAVTSGIDAQACLRDIQTSADMSLQLLDSYLLSLRLSLEPATRLSLEPVSVSATLYETARQLQDVARQYGVTIDLHVHGRYEPVMAHKQALQAALVSLGYALIEAIPASGAGKRHVQLATHRTKHGIVAGMYGELDALTPELFQRARQLQGRARQPLVGTMSGSGAGVFIADALLGAMASKLRVGRFQKSPGFAVTLAASEQLQLV
jgi:hypothetical protein